MQMTKLFSVWAGETVRLIRAFNVLRQYEEKDFIPAYEKLSQYILPGGLMIEGTSNPFGSIWCANMVRKTNSDDVTLSEAKSLSHRSLETLRSLYSLRVTTEWNFEALVFSTNFRSGFDVDEFQTILPKPMDQNNGLPRRQKTLREKGLK